jgi:catalase (peroxidase I)
VNKIRRNQPCPCGSGKKYKRRHGDPASAAETEAVDRAASFARIATMRHHARQKEIEKQFGLGRPPISFESLGHKIVAVGPEVHWSTSWKTFPDFLMSYFKNVMGKEWGEAQLAKPRDQWHPFFAWYAMICEYQKRFMTVRGRPQRFR